MSGDEIESVVLHPPVAEHFTGSEHPLGQLGHLGDALGVDCLVREFVDGWMRSHSGDGSRNEDWYAWNCELLAPFDGTVVGVRINPETNQPGTMGTPPASAITFLANDGETHVVYAHVQDLRVAEGDSVLAGDVVALIGNNGMCRHPHVHVGAWRNETPLQVRFDLAAMGRLHGHE